MEYVNSARKVIARVIASAGDGRNQQIWIGGNPQRYAVWKKKFRLRQSNA